MEDTATQSPDAKTLAGLGAIVLIGGTNFVAVRLSNRGLAPLYGAGLRFMIASLALFAYMTVRRIPFPRRQQMKGTLIYGVLGFGVAYACAYLALVRLPSAVAAVIMGAVPLITLFLARIHKIEQFRVRGLIGSAIAILGIGVIVGTPSKVHIAIGAVLTMIGAALSAAESGVIIKKYPTGHPIATNAVAMFSGSVLLLIASAVAGDHWVVPKGAATLASFGYLVALGSIAMFGLFLFTLKRWTASGVSYMFVLTPIVASISGAILTKESVPSAVIVGGLIVMAGVYFGALSGHKAHADEGNEQTTTPLSARIAEDVMS